MVKQTALMESLSSNLHNFLKQIGKNLSLPDRKFLRDALVGLLRAGRPVVSHMARRLPDQRTKFLSRRDRLEEHLTKDGNFEDAVKQSLPKLWLPFIKDDTPIILDLSDIAKPSAKWMDYLATVRDGSTGQLVNGYWMVELYASVSRKNPIPIHLEPFSHEQPECAGQNPVVLDAVDRIFKLTDRRGVLVADRGFDAKVMFADWLDKKYRFVVRLVGDRYLLRFFGNSEQSDDSAASGQWVSVLAGTLAEQTPTPHRWTRLVRRRRRVRIRLSQVGWVKVRLPGRAEVLTMVISRFSGRDTPLMLLTNLAVEDLRDAQRVLRYYVRRWECEEGIRFLKIQVNLEKIRTFRWSAICRLVLLAVLVMIYLGWIVETAPALCERLIRFSQPLPDKPDFLLYRMLTGLTEAINGCFWLRRDLLRRRLGKKPTV